MILVLIHHYVHAGIGIAALDGVGISTDKKELQGTTDEFARY